MINQVRISKYDPKYRIDGVYRRDEWTSISDIGDQFEEKQLHKEEYLRVERDYIQCIITLFRMSNEKTLHIDKLQKNTMMFRWRNNQVLLPNKIELFIEDCLREKCWGHLSNPNFFVHFGYDYYIYVGCDVPLEDIARIVSDNHLFMEIVISPYSKNFLSDN